MLSFNRPRNLYNLFILHCLARRQRLYNVFIQHCLVRGRPPYNLLILHCLVVILSLLWSNDPHIYFQPAKWKKRFVKVLKSLCQRHWIAHFSNAALNTIFTIQSCLIFLHLNCWQIRCPLFHGSTKLAFLKYHFHRVYSSKFTDGVIQLQSIWVWTKTV